MAANGLPATRNQTYLPGVTDVASVDMNGLQDETVRAAAHGYGDGSDGPYTFDGVAAGPAWTTKVGTVYKLNRDAQPTQVLVTGAGVVLDFNGFALVCSVSFATAAGGSLSCNGVAGTNGAAGLGGNGGAARAAGSLGGSGAGARGSDNPNGAAPAGGDATFPSGGGTGGAGGGGSAAGNSTGPVATSGSFRRWGGPKLAGHIIGGGALARLSGGSGGGGGGNSSALNSGGGGGSGGGCGALYAPIIDLASAADIKCAGGNGGNAQAGASGNAGGGGGGGGGYLEIACAACWIASARQVASPFSAAVNVPGGTGGALLNGGTVGANGSTGNLVVFFG